MGEQEPGWLSAPGFMREAGKGLVLDCPCPQDKAGQGEDVGSDSVAIREVTFQSVIKSKWKDTSYMLNTNSLAEAFTTPAGCPGQRAATALLRVSRWGLGTARSTRNTVLFSTV